MSDYDDQSINSLAEFTDREEVDPDAMLSDAPPPPPSVDANKKKIVYTISLENKQDGAEKPIAVNDCPKKNVSVFEYEGKKHLNIALLMKVQDGSRVVTRSIYVNTMKKRDIPTTEVDCIIKALGGQSAGLDNGSKIKTLYDLLESGTNMLRGPLEWKGTKKVWSDKKNKEVEVIATVDGKKLNRMVNFPLMNIAGTTQYKPVTMDDEGAEVRTEFEITDWLPLNYGGQ